MNPYLLCLLPICLLAALGYTTQSHAISHSFFQFRDVTTDSLLELSLTNHHRYHTTREGYGNWYIKPFFMRSTNGTQLARYLLPNHQACVTLDESGHGDIDPLWLNLIAPAGTFYTSTLSLYPQRQVGGVLFTCYLNISPAWWVGINTAAMQVNTNAHLCESQRSQQGTIPGFENAYQAFTNPLWCAGKISECAQTTGGLDDIQFKLGYDGILSTHGHATLYLVATAPTGTRARSTYLFQPLIGSPYGSFGAGIDTESLLWRRKHVVCSWMLDVKYRYIFGAMERRSFDLCNNGDWSRYLLVVPPSQLLNSQPGINLFTLPVRVTPGSTIDLWTAFNLDFCAFNVEIGYDFWWRAAEKIGNICSRAPGYGIQTLALCGYPLSSASSATISQAVQGTHATVTDATFVPLTSADLNIASGAHPAACSQKISINIGYTLDSQHCSGIVGLGTSYEFAPHNALAQYALWITLGLNF